MNVFTNLKSSFGITLQADDKSERRNPSLNLKLWQQRWENFSPNGDGFIWYGIDSEGSIAEFICEDSYIPEEAFEDIANYRKLEYCFDNLPEITTAEFPLNYRYNSIAPGKYHFGNLTPPKEANRGIYVFSEAADLHWYESGNYKQYSKNPYELNAVPERKIKVTELPKSIQKLLEPFHFQNVKFADFNFLDASKFFECKE